MIALFDPRGLSSLALPANGQQGAGPLLFMIFSLYCTIATGSPSQHQDPDGGLPQDFSRPCRTLAMDRVICAWSELLPILGRHAMGMLSYDCLFMTVAVHAMLVVPETVVLDLALGP